MTWASAAGKFASTVSHSVDFPFSNSALQKNTYLMARPLIDSATSKTGIVLKDSGARDEHGMQPLDDVFSSPDKESRNGADELDDESDEEPMDIDEGEFGTSRRIVCTMSTCDIRPHTHHIDPT